jgi:hypothetical protein
MAFALPSRGTSNPQWQQPVNPASLIIPSALDSCFTLLDKLSGRPCATSAGSASSSSFGSGLRPVIRSELVCALGWTAMAWRRHVITACGSIRCIVLMPLKCSCRCMLPVSMPARQITKVCYIQPT